MSSATKTEANRRNGRKSLGPKTDEGKSRSRLNALKHGMRANLLVLPGEDAEACQARVDAWTDSLEPRNESERYLAERTARITLQLDRIERAYVARVSANINNAAEGLTEPEGEDVLTLGRRLFWDARGPLALYPHHGIIPHREEARVSFSGDVDDPNNPGRLVLALESSAKGCDWLTDRWAELRSLLERGQAWRSPDKLRAARLLGRQPADALDDPVVGTVFLACHKIDPSAGELFHEIWNDMQTREVETAKKQLKSAPPSSTRPKSEAEARKALLSIVDQSVARLKTIAEEHRKRTEANAGLTANLLAFDASPEGERLRRYEISCSRLLLRSLDAFDKRHQAADNDRYDGMNLFTRASIDECLPISGV